tara:strand:- start:6996 stop:7991 length:996 start_codon:yes stop_codon:yes gene_type:complete
MWRHTRSQCALKLAEERKFDELLEHLRSPASLGLLGPCGRRIGCLLEECVDAGTPALGVIELLVERGAEPRIVFQAAAYGGQVELLEAACARNWHSEHTYREIFEVAAKGARQTDSGVLSVFEWITTVAREKYFGGNMLQDLVPERNPTRDERRPKDLLLYAFQDVLVGECFEAADYLMHHTGPTCFGLANAGRMCYVEDGDNSFLDELIWYVLFKNARTECLDFLCTRFDKNHVVETVHGYLQANNDPDGRDYYWTDAYWDDVVRWYQVFEREQAEVGRQLWVMSGDAPPHPGREHLMNAMATLDTVKERLPEGAYLKITSNLQKVYETM